MTQIACAGCRDGAGLDFPIAMAFQPIVNVRDGFVFAQEALVRGPDGESAEDVLSCVNETNKYAFDQQCRVTAIELAAALGVADKGALLSINFLPNAIYDPRACIRLTLTKAMQTGFPVNSIIFEFTEVERVDTVKLLDILRTYRAMGFKTAVDDFGSGYAGLELLSHFQPDLVKLDMALIRDIDKSPAKQAIVANTLAMLRDLGVTPICEGVESVSEFEYLRGLDVELMQGFLFAEPALGRLPAVRLSASAMSASAEASG